MKVVHLLDGERGLVKSAYSQMEVGRACNPVVCSPRHLARIAARAESEYSERLNDKLSALLENNEDGSVDVLILWSDDLTRAVLLSGVF